MANPTGESDAGVLKLDFDRRLVLQFCGSVVTSDAELLAYREFDDVLGLTTMASDVLADARTGKDGRHASQDGWPAVGFVLCAHVIVRDRCREHRLKFSPECLGAERLNDVIIHARGFRGQNLLRRA